MRNPEIKGLTSLRGLAAFYVSLMHFSAMAQTCADGPIPSLAPSGGLAVDLFFVLSGFIIAYVYLHNFRQNGLRAYPGFLAHRIARIYPLNVTLLLTLVAITLICNEIFDYIPFPDIKTENLGWNLVVNLLLLQGFGIGHTLNGPAWSISDELTAYLIFPLLAALIFHRWFLVCAGLVLASLAGLTIMASQRPNFQMDPTAYGIYWDIMRCVAEFTLGLASFRFYRSLRFRQRLSSDMALSVIILAIAAIVLLRLGELFAMMLFPFLIVAIARNRGRWQYFFEHPVLYFMGLISFSLYLVHGPIRAPERSLLLFLHPQPLGTTAALFFAFFGSLSVIAPAWLSYKFIERPGRKILRLAFSRHDPVKEDFP